MSLVSACLVLVQIHCEFFQNRLYNFNGTNEPGPSLDHADCSDLSVAFKSTQLKSSASSLVDEPGVTADFDQHRSDFGTLYYHTLLNGKGIIYADQQLMEGEETRHWVKEYVFHPTLFHQDFTLAMMKLSDLRVLTLPMGQIQLNCSKVVRHCCQEMSYKYNPHPLLIVFVFVCITL